MALIATKAGCVIEAPLVGKLSQPLDTESAVAWVGYANPALARHIRPVLRRLIREMEGPAPAGPRLSRS